MSVNDGQRVNAEVTNAAYISRTTDSDTVGVVSLNNPLSGGNIANTQQQINDNAANIVTNTSDIATNTSNVATNTADIAALQSSSVDESTLTTKGDIFARDASAITRLGVGADGTVLTADSTEPTGLKWEVASGGSSTLAYRNEVASYSLVGSDVAVSFTTGASDLVATLPLANSVPSGTRFKISKNDTGTGSVQVIRSGSDMISGGTEFWLHKNDNHLELVGNGVDTWDITGIDVTDVRTVSLTSNITISSDGVPSDITGMSLDLDWGDWFIYYDVTARLQKTTNAGQIYGQLFVADSGNIPATRTYSMFGNSSIAASQSIYTQLNMHTILTLTAPTTYKLRGEFTDNGSAGSGNLQVFGPGFSLFSSGTDGSARFTAERIK